MPVAIEFAESKSGKKLDWSVGKGRRRTPGRTKKKGEFMEIMGSLKRLGSFFSDEEVFTNGAPSMQ